MQFSPLAGTLRFDICVVGAGFTGLGTALELVKRGFKVAVLEAGLIGEGASGASGGQIASGYNTGMIEAAEIAGEEGVQDLWDLSERSKKILFDRIRHHKIQCDLGRGEIYAAVKPSHYQWLQDEKKLCEERFGFEGYELIPQEEMQRYIGSSRYVGALLDHEGGHIHPLNYSLGMADAAISAGAHIFAQSKALSYRHETGKVVIETEAGEIIADSLILAGNAYINNIAPPLLKRMIPVKSSILATEVLPDTLRKEIWSTNACVCDTNFDLDYYKMSADGRLIYGGQDFSLLRPNPPWKIIQRNMLRTFPQLEETAIDFFWSGKIAVTRTLLPDVGQLDKNVFYAHGYSGQGVTLSAGVSEILADAVVGQMTRLDIFSKLPRTRVPKSKLLQVPAVYAAAYWKRIIDLIN
ncbi:FAD-dependent oxidoreductase [Sneathiella sp. P13V-1]|uniref:NAD(P)/FAD-dependent oxidoreductase n=1 Tax=Sneathiella sp. P13V-1 TaxID=2697366 RepID=UPI00187B6C04|nr:FAD-binding oxidoreductase [Sneathiella sp. P13V-1]MBE7636898.1 FAD-dependent oxidoreductase [Sneathiella sp. P13V-1]